jgi:hypothetical protein
MYSTYRREPASSSLTDRDDVAWFLVTKIRKLETTEERGGNSLRFRKFLLFEAHA